MITYYDARMDVESILFTDRSNTQRILNLFCMERTMRRNNYYLEFNLKNTNK